MLIRVTRGPLDDVAARAAVSTPANGAVLVFYGIVRDHHQGRVVERIEYHAYEAMAEQELRAIAAESAVKHGVLDVAVLHRLGPLAVGDVSLVVAIGAPHRSAAFACGLELIDLLKQRVPIWKHEFGPDGAVWQDGALPAEPA